MYTFITMSSLHSLLLIIMIIPSTLLLMASPSHGDQTYVREACNVTRYRDLCIRSLSPYSNSAKRSPHKWAQAGVAVTMEEAKSTAKLLNMIRASGRMRRRQRAALSDCLECFDDTMGNLARSAEELMRLSSEKSTFEVQMGNVETWMSAALTFEDTCLDGFDGVRKGRAVKQLRREVVKVSCITSNALALVSKLASVGG
ncbi:hypothetical protein Sjap_007466 [Stephania japonica]|uniref:Pectinesterase inhibitor domain-containing protein n=1 Tax=Stephania japonica TaxID=461633 RepID=A0AAP0JMT1_9MAGN